MCGEQQYREHVQWMLVEGGWAREVMGARGLFASKSQGLGQNGCRRAARAPLRRRLVRRAGREVE